MVKKSLIYLCILAPLASFLLAGVTCYFLLKIPYTGEKKVFTINPGDGFSKINYRLEKNGLIFSSKLFYYLAKYEKSIGRFKAGSFTITNGMDSFQVMSELVDGKPILLSITVPEGKNIFEIADYLDKKGILSKAAFLEEVKKEKYLKKYSIPSDLNLEGFLFPDTYLFAAGVNASTVVKTFLQNFDKKTKDLNLTSQKKFSLFQLITLASIVEKETGAAFERPIIAGVFHNRLKKKMRLQSDPTTIYGIWNTYKGNIKKKHLLQRTPYNTYKIPGLPKGPIANPSLKAIQAVISPKGHQFLFFVSKNDGTHIFTKTYKDHLSAVEKWQKNRKNRKGKSWRNLKQ